MRGKTLISVLSALGLLGISPKTQAEDAQTPTTQDSAQNKSGDVQAFQKNHQEARHHFMESQKEKMRTAEEHAKTLPPEEKKKYLQETRQGLAREKREFETKMVQERKEFRTHEKQERREHRAQRMEQKAEKRQEQSQQTRERAKKVREGQTATPGGSHEQKPGASDSGHTGGPK